MFVHEPQTTSRQEEQIKTDKIFESKFGSSNILSKSRRWLMEQLLVQL